MPFATEPVAWAMAASSWKAMGKMRSTETPIMRALIAFIASAACWKVCGAGVMPVYASEPFGPLWKVASVTSTRIGWAPGAKHG